MTALVSHPNPVKTIELAQKKWFNRGLLIKSKKNINKLFHDNFQFCQTSMRKKCMFLSIGMHNNNKIVE